MRVKSRVSKKNLIPVACASGDAAIGRLYAWGVWKHRKTGDFYLGGHGYRYRDDVEIAEEGYWASPSDTATEWVRASVYRAMNERTFFSVGDLMKTIVNALRNSH